MNIKSYFLLSSLASSLLLYAMDQQQVRLDNFTIAQKQYIDLLQEDVNKILSKDECCICFFIPRFFYYNASDVKNYLSNIEKKIDSKAATSQFFSELYTQNTGFRFLIDSARNAISEVYGYTINLVPFCKLTALQEFIYKDLHEYLKNDYVSDVHNLALYGHEHAIDPYSLQITNDSKYLKSTDDSNKTIIWDLQNGKQTDMSSKNFTWQDWRNNRSVISYISCNPKEITNPLYYSPEYKDSYGRPKKTIKYKPVVSVSVHPKTESLICCNTLKNSINNLQALEKLNNADILKKVTGFPQQNIKNKIKKHIKELKKK